MQLLYVANRYEKKSDLQVVSSRINLPAPCFSAIAACGSW